MRNLILSAALIVGATSALAQSHPVEFKKHILSKEFFSEGATAGDFNHDGKMDIVSGPYWYEGPDFKIKHEYYPAKAFDPHGYSQNFLAFVDDLNGDGWDDILIVGFPGAEAYWYENPKSPGGTWQQHLIHKTLGAESPGYYDLLKNGHKQFVCCSDDQLGYLERDPDPNKPWHFHPITAKGPWGRFTHGTGAGDINGDGRMDILDRYGWYEQPASLQGDPKWISHPYRFGDKNHGDGGAQILVYDVDGDGKNDVITSLQAHGYGLAWFKQIEKDGKIDFERHVIMGALPEQNAQGVVFTQLHALDLADINGDGLMDIVTGKRHWAHAPPHGGDADPDGPAVLYWFELKRDNGNVQWIAHKIDDNSGVGTQVIAKDVNGDGKTDIIVGNKKGTFVFTQK